MNKKEILSLMREKAIEKELYYNKTTMENIIEIFKESMLDCLSQGEVFNYSKFFEVTPMIIEEKECINPKTREPFIDRRKYKPKIKLKYSIRRKIKGYVVK